MRAKIKPNKIIFTNRKTNRIRPIERANHIHIWQKNLYCDDKELIQLKRKEFLRNQIKKEKPIKQLDKIIFYFGNEYLENFTYNSFSIIMQMKNTYLKGEYYEKN